MAPWPGCWPPCGGRRERCLGDRRLRPAAGDRGGDRVAARGAQRRGAGRSSRAWTAGRLEPLLAVYEPQALPLLERLGRSGGWPHRASSPTTGRCTARGRRSRFTPRGATSTPLKSSRCSMRAMRGEAETAERLAASVAAGGATDGRGEPGCRGLAARRPCSRTACGWPGSPSSSRGRRLTLRPRRPISPGSCTTPASSGAPLADRGGDLAEEERSAVAAVDLMAAVGFDPGLTERVAGAIRELYREAVDPCLTTRLVADADSLDKLGLPGVAIFFVKQGLRGVGLGPRLLRPRSGSSSHTPGTPPTRPGPRRGAGSRPCGRGRASASSAPSCAASARAASTRCGSAPCATKASSSPPRRRATAAAGGGCGARSRATPAASARCCGSSRAAPTATGA